VMSEFSQGFPNSSCNCQSWCFSMVSLLFILTKGVITPTYPNWMQVNPRGEIYGGAERNFHCVPVGETFRDKLWLDRIFSDTSCSSWVQLSSAVLFFSNDCCCLIRKVA
jgi:hypothetical protein